MAIATRTRLSIDLFPEEYQMIKLRATLQRKTMRQYVVEHVLEHLHHETEEEQLQALTTHISPVLKELWDNEKDAVYDKL